MREQINTRSSAINEETLPENQTKKISYTGRVKEMGYSVYMQGTHYLVDENGRTLALLESSKVTLDDYLDKIITAYGTIQRTVEGDGIIMTVDRVLVQ